jgi:hypothetical protein
VIEDRPFIDVESLEPPRLSADDPPNIRRGGAVFRR